MKITGKDVIKHINKLKTDRSLYNSLFNDVKYWFAPTVGDFFAPESETEGDNKYEHIESDHGTFDAERLSQVLYSTVMPVHEQFFTLVPNSSETEDMKLWWHEATEILSNELSNSNLPTSAMQVFKSLVYFGTAPIYATLNKGKLSYTAYYPDDVFIDIDYDRVVDTLVTSKRTTARNLVKKYGKSQVSPQILENSNRLDGKDNVVVYSYFYLDSDSEAWKMAVVEEKTKHIITEYAFTSKPFQCPRWQATNYEVYGRSPASRALTNVIKLNRVERTLIRAVEKHVDPVIAIPFDSNAEELGLICDTDAGGIIEVMPDQGGAVNYPTVVPLGGSVESGQYQVDKLEDKIDKTFYLDVLTLIMDMSAQATATQIDSANAEKLDLIVPIIVQLISELIKPLIERSFQLLLDEGIIPPPPSSVGEDELEFEVEVQSSLIVKLRQMKIMASMQSLDIVAKVAQFAPEGVDRINGDKLIEHIIVQSTLPTDSIRAGSELEDYREEKAIAQANEMKRQMATEMVTPIDIQKTPEEGSVMDNPEGIAQVMGGL